METLVPRLCLCVVIGFCVMLNAILTGGALWFCALAFLASAEIVFACFALRDILVAALTPEDGAGRDR